MKELAVHEHQWNEIARIADGESVDTYFSCACSRVLHVYTYVPGNIRHEDEHEGASWTAGYAHGLARGLKS